MFNTLKIYIYIYIYTVVNISIIDTITILQVVTYSQFKRITIMCYII